jgi:threonine dehydrogenase-like Zn-dependent dehydrogenase
MKALCWHGKGDMRYETVPDPKMLDARDAIIKVTACAICGSAGWPIGWPSLPRIGPVPRSCAIPA